MFCGQCGAEIRDGSAFCPKCGASQAANPGQGTAPQTMGNASLGQGTGLQALEAPGKSDPAKEKGIPIGGIVAIAAAGLAAVIVVIASVFFLMPDRRNDEETRRNAVKETPLYSIPDVAMVDLVTENRALGVKQPGMAWDSSLFYWLEDVDTTSPDDGYIAKCRVTKTLLRDALTQKLRQYEIYSDPDSGAIYKIVSVEETDGGVDLVDYYYRDGQPDFIFKREDTVYTPTYATPTKTGERYYFNSDVMVRWRIIREPGVIGEYVLAPREVNYSQADYYAESDELRSTYDETEKRMFHAACNTYDAIVAGGNIGLVQGVLCDTLGNGVEGKTVKVYRESDNVLLYEAATDVNGAYSFFVYLDGTPCYLKADGDELYRETLVQGVQFLQSAVNYSYGLTMHKNGGDEYPVMLHAYSCMDVVSDENETALGTPIQTVTATVREGAGNYRGESIRTVETQNGELVTNLPSGAYTVQLHAEGYLDSYMELEVGEDAAARDAYIMPGLAENQTGIVLTWDSDETDLDLTLFTPYQAANGDMAHIGGGVDRDSYGNILVSDNKSRCEAMLINSGEQGSYKLYVSNYTDSSAGNYSSDALYRINVHVYIYNSDGFLAEYTIPLGQSGVVWEVAEVNGRTVTPAQRVYADISGKSWWTGSKDKELVIYTCITETETFSQKTRSYKEYEYNEYGKLSLLHEIYSVSDVLERNAEGTAKYGESMERDNATYTYTYDAYDNVKKEVYEGATGTSYREWEYTYIDGHMTEEYEYDYGSGGLNGVTVTKYDEKERIISEQRDSFSDFWFYNKSEEEITEFVNINFFVGREETMMGTLYICDENGAVLREEWYEGSSYVNIRTVEKEYSYDDRGNCVAFRNTDSWGENWYYNEANQLIQHESRYGTGATNYTETYSYNSLGKLESVHCDYDNDFYGDSDTLYYYDAKGNLIKTVTTTYYDDYESMGFFGIDAMYYDGSRWIVALEQTEYTYY